MSAELIAYANDRSGRHPACTVEEIAAECKSWRAVDDGMGVPEVDALRRELGYWQASYRNLLAATLHLAKSLASHREELHVGTGDHLGLYKVECDPDEPSAPVRLVKTFSKEQDAYTIAASAEASSETLTAGPHAGYSCDCPDFRHRHAGTPSHGCKHIRAAAAFGRLPVRPEAPDADDHADGYEWAAESRDDDARHYASLYRVRH